MMIKFSRFWCNALKSHDDDDDGNDRPSNVHAVGIHYYPIALLFAYTTFSDDTIYSKILKSFLSSDICEIMLGLYNNRAFPGTVVYICKYKRTM